MICKLSGCCINFLDSMRRIQQSGWGQYNGSTELVVRLNESLLWRVCFKEVIKTIMLVILKSLYHFELLHEICFVQYNGISAAYTLEISQSRTNSYIQYTFSIILKDFPLGISFLFIYMPLNVSYDKLIIIYIHQTLTFWYLCNAKSAKHTQQNCKQIQNSY